MSILTGIGCIIWINLDRSVDRARRMTNMFKDPVFAHIPIIRFSAIDGKKPHLVENLLETIQFPNKILEYACLLSHIESIRQFLTKTSYANALILEDDATLELKPFWNTSVKDILGNTPKGAEALLLCYMSNKLPPYIYTYNTYSHGNVKYWSTLAYIITRSGAERFIQSQRRTSAGKYRLTQGINPDADVYMWAFIRAYVYRYPMFIYADDETSTLNHDVAFHVQSKKRIIQMVAHHPHQTLTCKYSAEMITYILCICYAIYVATIGDSWYLPTYLQI
jgi:GR25 family glycosyltransferase involved in LPS biosynthesis